MLTTNLGCSVAVLLLPLVLNRLGEAAMKLTNSDERNGTENNITMLYDLHSPAYETVLTPIDFELALELEDHPRPGSADWDSEAMYSLDKFEGDIANDINASTVPLFIRGAPEGNDVQLNAIRDRRQMWRNARIPYALSSQYSSYSRSIIASAMQEYAKHTCIQWTPRTAMDMDYVYIEPQHGCYSMVGRTGGKQTLSLGNGCIQRGIIIHEMMHAVGFFHEQSRTDRDDFITVLWHNILPGMLGQFEKYSATTIQTLGSDYDYGSIMHYGPNAFTRNGLPTMVPRRQAVIGQRAGFSKLDAWKINALYECPSYGGVYGGASTSAPAQPITAPATVATLTTTAASVTPRVCRNTRPDCDQLARQGWCTRNPQWMRDHCPASCGWCPAERAKSAGGGGTPLIGLPAPLPIVPPAAPSSTQSPPAPPAPEPICEDLRVDCDELAKRRYCITAPTFMRTYCARTCGFCFVPLSTDAPPPTTPSSTTTQSMPARPPTVYTQQPMVTFWPPLNRPDRQSGGEASSPVPPPAAVANKGGRGGGGGGGACRDRKHFCATWAKSGFCRGIFTAYMRKNCAAACGWC